MRYLVGTIKLDDRTEVTLQEIDKFGRPVGDACVAMGFQMEGVIASGTHAQLVFIPFDEDYSPSESKLAYEAENETLRDAAAGDKKPVKVKPKAS